jgi:type IV secretion system protein VirB9
MSTLPPNACLRSMCAWVWLGVAQLTVAEMTPTPGSGDRRVRSALYDAEQIYRLTAQVGYQIELEFELGEYMLGQGAGDLEGIAIAAYENHVFLKPKAADVKTNVTIATNRRRYRFDYAVEARAPTRNGENVMYVVRFSYPPVNDGPSAAERIEHSLSERADDARNLDYWFCGHRSIRPIAASDDGVHTRFTFDASGELPALFVLTDDGSESLLNFSMEEGDVVVHRVARQFILRRGRLTGCVVNKGFTGSSVRLESGTVSPEVQRERRGLVP